MHHIVKPRLPRRYDVAVGAFVVLCSCWSYITFSLNRGTSPPYNLKFYQTSTISNDKTLSSTRLDRVKCGDLSQIPSGHHAQSKILLNTKPRSCEPGKNTLNFFRDLFPLSRPSSTVLSYKLPPTESEAPIRSNLYGLVTAAPNRITILRQSLHQTVLLTRLPIVTIQHNL